MPNLRDLDRKERIRLNSLLALDVLDTSPEVEFDALVNTAALICDVPISLISLVDEKRQWFKAQVGLNNVSETPREVALCATTIYGDGLFEVNDAALDLRFANNPLITDEPSIRFYAGVPLKLSDGSKVGSICVIDTQPRTLTQVQREVLVHLAKSTVHALESRRAAFQFSQKEAELRALTNAAPLGVFFADLNGECTFTNERLQVIFGFNEADALGSGWQNYIHHDDSDEVRALWSQSVRENTKFDSTFRIRKKTGVERRVRCITAPALARDGVARSHVGSIEDVTEKLKSEADLHAERFRLSSILEATGVGTWEVDYQSDRVFVDDQWAGILGLPDHDSQNLSIAEFRKHFHPEDLERSDALLAEHITGRTKSYQAELRLRHRLGHWVWVQDRGKVISWANGRPERLFGTFHDITERKAQQQTLERSERFLDRTGRAAGIGGWELDVATQSMTWSDETCRIHGQRPGHQPNLHEALQHYAPEVSKVLQSAVDEAMKSGKGWDLELPMITKQGGEIWVRAVGNAEFTDGKVSLLFGAFQDITQRILDQQEFEVEHQRVQDLSAELTEQHERMRVTLQSIGDAVITTDEIGRVTWLNPVAETMTGWLNDEAMGRMLEQVFYIQHETTRLPVENPVMTCLKVGTPVGLAAGTVLISRSGVEFGIEDSAAPILSGTGDVLGVVLVFHDVTEARRQSGEMTYRATHDPMTDVLNRSEFETRLAKLLRHQELSESKHALLFIDLDQFKLVNDACGHSVGDDVLKQVSKLFKKSIRSNDMLARIGGDEFAIILENCGAEEAQVVAQKICDHMDIYRFNHDGKSFRIGTSIGLVSIDRQWNEIQTLVRAADAACIAAKDGGRNRVHVWDDTDGTMILRQGEMRWASRLEEALDEGRFELFAQHIVPTKPRSDGVFLEVLIRMVEPNGVLILPGAFLSAAERFNLMTRIDKWVLDKTFETLGSVSDLSLIDTVSINISGKSLGDRGFHRLAVEKLRIAGPAIAKRICFEVSETAAAANMADVTLFIEQVHKLGVRIALDDFGSGAASFGYLKLLDVDYLKIDGQFISNLDTDPLSAAAVRSFVDVANVLGIPTIAEFISSQELRELVGEFGVDYVQGFAVNEPEPFGQLLARKFP